MMLENIDISSNWKTDYQKLYLWVAPGRAASIVRIPEQSYHPFRFIVTTDSAAL
jgi:hypothetical protein